MTTADKVIVGLLVLAVIFCVGCIILVTGGIMYSGETNYWHESSCTVLDQSAETYQCPSHRCTGTTAEGTCSSENSTCTNFTTLLNITWEKSSNVVEWKEYYMQEANTYYGLKQGDTVVCYYNSQRDVCSLRDENTSNGFTVMMVGCGFIGFSLGALLLCAIVGGLVAWYVLATWGTHGKSSNTGPSPTAQLFSPDSDPMVTPHDTHSDHYEKTDSIAPASTVDRYLSDEEGEKVLSEMLFGGYFDEEEDAMAVEPLEDSIAETP